MRAKLQKLLVAKRLSPSTVTGRSLAEEFLSDQSRILFSSSFRRLQQKAQVFSLETNSNVRSRLTHSLEVADTGRALATKILKRLEESDYEFGQSFVTAVANACLLHDLGNPPFGHFGETAIKKWFQKNGNEVQSNALRVAHKESVLNDFLFFDGNPQGLRIATRLHCERDKYGLNLTYTGIASMVKYPTPTLGANVIYPKIGYFSTEQDIVDNIWQFFGIPKTSRFPLSYLMEAADDIAYSTSDIQDGIEKGILTSRDFIEELKDLWEENKWGKLPFNINEPDRRGLPFSVEYAINWSHHQVERAVEIFFEHFDSFLDGKVESLFSLDTEYERFRNCIRSVCRKRLYRSPEAENIELAGFRIIDGLLDSFKPLLEMTRSDFELLLNARRDPTVLKRKDRDVEWRLFNKIGSRYVKSYEYCVADASHEEEWIQRAHMLVDQISGMTDKFALDTYHLLQGVRTWTRQ